MSALVQALPVPLIHLSLNAMLLFNGIGRLFALLLPLSMTGSTRSIPDNHEARPSFPLAIKNGNLARRA
ncbi:MAG: hypothetical protein NVV59_04060 [Chitinophagaceae bacterium]|nr:hypothetical protein [Chitinophagaceae bacterium]